MSGDTILNDNIMYLNAWMNYNPSFRDSLKINGEYLVWAHGEDFEQISIKDFYLPTLLYNQMFQRDIQNPEVIQAEDLFRIIRVHVLSDDYTKLKQRKNNDILLVNFKKKRNSQGTEFVSFEDNIGHHYQINHNIGKVSALYEKLFNQNGFVRFLDFKLELEKMQNESQR